VAKNKKLLQQEAEGLYQWSKKDFSTWPSPDEEFGPLRIDSRPFPPDKGNLEATLDELSGHQWRDDNDRTYVDQALKELEERGAWQA